ncbi:AI-2E family transporter [Pontibacter sp. 172403-2]|uniref:AI-2E family transporter n=1 Tax=Pontibacter rufus TaxID=2791028 RepID=UPI0018AF9869|nr:AI-2E family transporter [Pontibacter sp. 172403-2]MBF9252732.1 AI-2E family transporter [Pontibacter sp. 172403-2]
MADNVQYNSSPGSDTKEPFYRKVLKAAGITLALLLFVLFIYYTFNSVLLLVFASVLIAIFFRGTADALSSRTGIPTGWSLALVMVVFLALTGLAWWLLAPQVTAQISTLSKELPRSIAGLEQQVQQYEWGRKLVGEIPTLDSLMESKNGWLQKSVGILSSTLGILANIYIVLFIAIFITINPKTYRQGIIMLFPLPKRNRAREVLDHIGSTLYKWILGKLFSMTVVGVMTSIGLSLLGIPMALALGFIAGLVSFIPNFGPIIALVPAVLIALLQGPNDALYVVLLYTGIQLVESNLLTPMVQKRMIEMPPALIISGQLLLGVFSGILGLILATPLIAMLIVIVKMLYVRDVLGDDDVHVG